MLTPQFLFRQMGKYKSNVEALTLPISALIDLARKYDDASPEILVLLSQISTVQQLLSVFSKGRGACSENTSEDRFEGYLLEHSLPIEVSATVAWVQDVINAGVESHFVSDAQIDMFNDKVHPEFLRIAKHFYARIEAVTQTYVKSGYSEDLRNATVETCKSLHTAMGIVMVYELEKALEGGV